MRYPSPSNFPRPDSYPGYDPLAPAAPYVHSEPPLDGSLEFFYGDGEAVTLSQAGLVQDSALLGLLEDSATSGEMPTVEYSGIAPTYSAGGTVLS